MRPPVFFALRRSAAAPHPHSPKTKKAASATPHNAPIACPSLLNIPKLRLVQL
jgi:hypothetical protein